LKKTGRHILLCGFLSLALGAVNAQETRFFMTVNKNQVVLNDNFQVRITFENGRGNVEPIDFSAFQVIAGPNLSTASQIIQGAVSTNYTMTYFLRPIKTGKFTLGPAKTVINGKNYATEAIVVEVLSGGSTSQQSPQSGGTSNYTQQPSADKNVQIIIELSKRKVYIGEQITARYVLLTRYRNLEATDTRYPTLPGFWSEEIKNDQSTWEPNLEMVNGVAYRKAYLKTQILFPQRAGTSKLEPIEFTCRVDRSLFNPGTEIKVKSNAPSIEVLAFPTGSPKGFDGAVGNLNFSATVSRTEVKVNEAIDLKINVSGSGNLTLIGAPKMEFPPDFEVYDPEIKDRISINAGGVNGTRSFQYLIIPRYPGSYEIPEMNFVWFNPAKAAYESVRQGPYTIQVTGEAGQGAIAGQTRARNKVSQSAQDIRYIYTDSQSLEVKNAYFFGSVTYYTALGSPLLLLMLVLFVRRRRDSMAQNTSLVRRRGANKMAKGRLKSAKKALDHSDDKLFYAEVFKALYGYLSDKLNIPLSHLTRPTILKALQDQNVDSTLSGRLQGALDTCEMARFAPVTDVQSNSFYGETVTLIEKLESNLK